MSSLFVECFRRSWRRLEPTKLWVPGGRNEWGNEVMYVYQVTGRMHVRVYCAISFNSAVTRHGASQNAEMSQLSRRFSWCAEFILTSMSPIYIFFRRLQHSTAEILGKSRQPWGVAETKISAGPSRVTGPAELNEMAQYSGRGFVAYFVSVGN
jgi:hypothetical protein